MDALTNPFAPGAGISPPALEGRGRIITNATTALGRIKTSRHSKSQMLLGLRGVGKTVLLNKIRNIARDQGYLTVSMEAPENRSLAETLAPELRRGIYDLSTIERAKDLVTKAFGALRNFGEAWDISIGNIDVSLRPTPGTADSGNLEADLPDLLTSVATAAAAADKPVAVLIDEVQYLKQEELSAVIASVHKIAQEGLPLILFGAGLPLLAALAGEAKSYAERLFDYPSVGALDTGAAASAVREPVIDEGATIEEEAVASIVRRTEGYPYFLQEWGFHSWNVAEGSPITVEDVEKATYTALDALDQGFFRVRFDRLTPREKHYMRAMAELGAGPHRSGDVADAIEKPVSSLAPLRGRLIGKGMIYSPSHGDTAFTVPMFDDFMRRTMPDWNPSEQKMDGRKTKKKKKKASSSSSRSS